MDNTLFLTLNAFHGVTDILDESRKLAGLSSQFENIANKIIGGSYFEINGIRRIYPLEIEFYYHEEGEDGLKDPVMYHTNNHEGKQVEYYPLGSLNCHVSGIDVTFENKEKQYRASFLIRKYKVCKYNGEKWEEKKACEKRPTYIYDDMMMLISLSDGISIEWKPTESVNASAMKIKPRINVAEYKRNEVGKYEKIIISESKFRTLSKEEKCEYFSYSGKKLKRCKRMWNYSVVDD